MAQAFDTSTTTFVSPGTSLTLGHTCTGSDRFLVTGTQIQTTSDNLTGVTYNSVAMNPVRSRVFAGGGNRLYLHVLHNPASGANNIVASSSSSTYINMVAASYTAAQQSSTVDASNEGDGTGNPQNMPLTTVAANCWEVAVAVNGSGMTAGSGTTKRQDSTFTELALFDSNGQRSAGDTAGLNTTGGGTISWIIASFAEPGGGGGGSTYPGADGCGVFHHDPALFGEFQARRQRRDMVIARIGRSLPRKAA